jgi:hypothetical protein
LDYDPSTYAPDVPPIHTFQITAITDAYHHAWFIYWVGVSLTFPLGWSQTKILQISAFPVALQVYATMSCKTQA